MLRTLGKGWRGINCPGKFRKTFLPFTAGFLPVSKMKRSLQHHGIAQPKRFHLADGLVLLPWLDPLKGNTTVNWF